MNQDRAKKVSFVAGATERDDAQMRQHPSFSVKWYQIVVVLLLLGIAALFVGWYLLPKKVMNIAVLDKTVISYNNEDGIVKEHAYRKHQGLFWLLKQQKYVKSDGSYYDYKKDYYGSTLDEEGNYAEPTDLRQIEALPDLVYLADAYGAENDAFGRYNGDQVNAGISADDMSVISYAYENGAAVVAEMTLFEAPLSQSVYSQLVSLCGVTPTKWVGRYVFNLQDFTDLPDWAPPMYEQQEGVEWRFSGPGMLLVSSEGRIIVLEQNTDFNSKNLLQIYFNDGYKKEFSGCKKTNFYNWFELIEPNYGTETLATFEFDLNATGMEKIKEISKTPRFAAITRKTAENHAPVYYFAGDFNDYVTGERYGKFLFADQFFRFLSYDRQGDISHFFWTFYNPLMRHILAQTRSSAFSDPVEDHAEISRVQGDTFQVAIDGKWKDLPLKAISINALEPGKQTYQRDLSYYDELVKYADDLGVNCLVAKNLLPPEFYSAVSRHNKIDGNRTLYILQTVTPPDDLSPDEYMTETGLSAWKDAVQTAVKALHGDGSAQSALLQEVSYFTDASAYLLGFIVDPRLDDQAVSAAVSAVPDYSYAGTYVRAAKGIEGFAAFLYDSVQAESVDTYGYHTPTAVRADMAMLGGMRYSSGRSYSFAALVTGAELDYYFQDVRLDKAVVSGSDYSGMDEYDAYFSLLSEIKTVCPSLVLSEVSFSNVNSIYGQSSVTEIEQGNHLVTVISAAKDAGLLGAIVCDLNDAWSPVSDAMYPYTVPVGNSSMWQNTCDERQMTGVVAMEGVSPTKAGLVLSDDDRVQRMSMYANENYLYITLQVFNEIDFSTEALFIGLDTFQRNDGEYYYSSEFTPNSLSGMEYVLRFDGKQEGALYVIPSYDRTVGRAMSEESYTGDFHLVSRLTYGGFTSGDNQFYQTGSTVYVRLPWTWLNVADPSNKLVISDGGPIGTQAKTITTNGVLFSVMIGDRATGDLIYAFPEQKSDPGYKVFEWTAWDTVSYSMRPKESYTILRKYYLSIAR